MKALIIHAGLPKTGTSALQVFLARGHDALRRQSFDYFKLGDFKKAGAGQITSGNGSLVARSLLAKDDPSGGAAPDQSLAALDKAIAASDCETGLLSSEYFAHCAPERLKSWTAGLREAGITPKFLYFIRAQDQLLSSMYVQYVKRSHCRETPEAYAARMYREVPYLKHASFHKTQLDIFGPGNVICRVYERAVQTPDGLATSFLEAIGADPAGLAGQTQNVNLGMTPAELAIMRELNKYRPHTRLSDQLAQNAGIAGITARGEVYRILPPEMVAEIHSYFAAENAEMAKLCFAGEAMFPASPRANAPTANLDEFSPHDLVNVLGGLLVRYDERIAHLESLLDQEAHRPWRRLARRFTAASAGVIRRQSRTSSWTTAEG
jgi:hypothetical protein